MSTRTIVYGANGHMGQILCRSLENAPDFEIAAKVSHSGGTGVLTDAAAFTGDADIVIDFSHHAGTKELLDFCLARSLPVVIVTTGHTAEELAAIDEAAKTIPVFRSANMSVGVALLARLVKEVAAKFHGCDIEIVETHHNRKLDAPSGTAIMLADAAKASRQDAEYVLGRSGHHKREANEIGISAVRRGNIVGTHEVFFGTNTQTITLKHEAHDRALFADGALDCARFLLKKPAGLYNMDDLLADE